MDGSQAELQTIKNQIIIGLLIGWMPVIIFCLILENNLFVFDDLSPEMKMLVSILWFVVIILFFWGYIICWRVSCKYAKYKGYHEYIGFIAGALNFYGLCFLFLLDNKKASSTLSLQENDFVSLNILSIIIASFIAIPLFIYPFLAIGFVFGSNLELEEAFNLLENKDISTIIYIFFFKTISFWYLYKKIVKSSINFKLLFGSLKIINIQLPLSLAILRQCFASGFNSFTLYIISFIIPEYVENYINKEHTNTYIGFIAFVISAIIFAPIWEELFYRGLIFQKIALVKGVRFAALASAFIFAIVHFRFDIIPLSIGGIIYVILYLKTKQLIIPMVSHFFFNLIAISFSFHHQFISDYDHSIAMTVAQYQDEFIKNIGWNVLLITLSAPYLIYFIYKNFPHNYEVSKLPYYANQNR